LKETYALKNHHEIKVYIFMPTVLRQASALQPPHIAAGPHSAHFHRHLGGNLSDRTMRIPGNDDMPTAQSWFVTPSA
jgi:hypothetical protein